MKSLAVVVSICLLLTVVACNAPTTAAILQTSLDSVVAVIAITNPTFDAATLKADGAAAVVAVKNWKQGTPSENVVQALDLLVGDINLIPVPDKYKTVVVIAVDGVKSVMAIIEGNSPQPVAIGGKAKAQKRGATIYRTPAQYKAAFNAQIAAHPELAKAKLK